MPRQFKHFFAYLCLKLQMPYTVVGSVLATNLIFG